MKIFDIDYLESADLTDEDLHFLFDLNGITYSFAIYLLKLSGLECSKNKFGKMLRHNENWMNEHILTNKQINESKKRFEKCIMNIYQYGRKTAKSWVEDWYVHYGLPSRVIQNTL